MTNRVFKRVVIVLILLSGPIALKIGISHYYEMKYRPSLDDLITTQNLKASISAYFTEYHRYPVSSETNTDMTLDTGSELMAALLGDELAAATDGLNPRKITFFEGRKAKSTGDGGFRHGVHSKSISLWDVYGKQYRVRMDCDYDSKVEAPDSKSGESIPTSVLVWSAGKDADFETWRDNAKTW